MDVKEEEEEEEEEEQGAGAGGRGRCRGRFKVYSVAALYLVHVPSQHPHAPDLNLQKDGGVLSKRNNSRKEH